MEFSDVLGNAGRAKVVWTINTAAAPTVMVKVVNLMVIQIDRRPSIAWR